MIFTANYPGEPAMWRISVGGGDPRRVPASGEQVSQPTVSRNRLAYVRSRGSWEVWKMELTGPDATKAPSNPLLSWSSRECDPCISPDAKRIVFGSDSSGSWEIWVCNADGTKPMKLTDMKAESTGSPSWSPDGTSIAFDSTKSGNADIYVVGVEGGPVRRMTTDPTDEVVPRWSRDSRWIYFGSNKSGSYQIWKMPSGGGTAIQVTRNGGVAARESVDGNVYYGDSPGHRKGLWRVPVPGGQEALVLDKDINPMQWDLTDRGIYFIDLRRKPLATICFFDFVTRQVKSLAPVHSDPGFTGCTGCTISPDAKWLLYSGGVITSDIMMIDNFR